MQNDKYTIFDKMVEGIQVINSRWEYVYVNDTLAKHGRSSKSELLGRTMIEMYPGIEKTKMYNHICTCLQFGTNHRMSNEFTFPDGSLGYFHLLIQPLDGNALIVSIEVNGQTQLGNER